MPCFNLWFKGLSWFVMDVLSHRGPNQIYIYSYVETPGV